MASAVCFSPRLPSVGPWPNLPRYVNLLEDNDRIGLWKGWVVPEVLPFLLSAIVVAEKEQVATVMSRAVQQDVSLKEFSNVRED